MSNFNHSDFINHTRNLINQTQSFINNHNANNSYTLPFIQQRNDEKINRAQTPSSQFNKSNIDNTEMNIFKKTVKQYVEIDNQVRDLKEQDKIILEEIKRRTEQLKEQRKKIKKEIKKREELKISLNKSITTFMESYNVPKLNIKSGRLTIGKKKVRDKLSRKQIEEKTREYFNNSEDYKAYKAFITKDLKKEVPVLKRTFKKTTITFD